MKRKDEIAIQAQPLTGFLQPSPQAWCAVCGELVRLVSAERAAALSRVSRRTIYRQVEAGRLHYAETSDGRLFICLESLLDSS